MALRACKWLFGKPTSVSRAFVVSAGREEASSLLGRGIAACRQGRNGFSFTPACFVSSDAFFNRLMKGRPEETDGSFSHLRTSVPSDAGEQLSLLVKHPDQPENPKVLKVAIVGAPNAGKSTLSNQLLGKKVFAVSKKVHTTRSQTLGVLTEADTQIILLDTPGLTTPSKVKRHHLEKSLLVDPWNTVKEADLMVVMVDVSDKWTCNKLDLEVLKCLAQHPNIPAVLILNKVDLLKNKSKLLDITAALTCGVVNGQRMRVRPVIKPPWAEKKPDSNMGPTAIPFERDGTVPNGSTGSSSVLSKEQLRALRAQKGWPRFKDLFMLSSVDSEDVGTLKSIELWQDGENGELDIVMKLYVKKDSHMKMVIGSAGQMVARIALEASEDLSRLFLREVRMKLTVKLRS
ncbi:GTPase Era, mitochondrial isoform X2 [Lampris incognitus]|uniref:GTPase Era, mitochondrial isoform X2 n=1 Tax=Lampris incognitus TaxID=2546036 RepID=UPI0024B50973|nr:GTPase Era, mitochondrial isoform X2 [Lampris incognitus]